ncbi:helix-turn-helix domain-containing protein [Sorangium sp. So ce315]|uniref:helix-turn-helix domain-containing protein n=1 Tax=Sorangium sp. So ce315 TaxID=3133299 RepID=UPI003F64775D
MSRVPDTAAPRKGGDITATAAELLPDRGTRAALLLALLDEHIEARVRELLEKATRAEADPWLDADSAGALLAVSRETAIRMARKREIAAVKLGSRMGWRFRRSDVLAYLEAKRRRPAPVAANDAEGPPTDAAGVLAELGLPAPRGRR